MNDNVIDMDKHKADNKLYYNIFALCVQCKYKWFAQVEISVNLFRLECPDCKLFDTFPSFIPPEYFEDLHNHHEDKTP